MVFIVGTAAAVLVDLVVKEVVQLRKLFGVS